MSSVKTHLIGIGLLFFVAVPFSIHGAVVLPDGSTETTLDKARNNVPVVNIANPNTAGLSHNRYSDFNINQEGLILNNATQSAVQTQLGGYIFGNPHLTSNATVILNEVTSTRRSALTGFAEVAGQSADLVIANPNGLTLNGAGFINTSRVTLTTGAPIFAAGSLQAFDVQSGDITIQGKGLNGQTTDVDIYSQFLQLNTGLYAKKLNLKLGTNTVDYPSGRVTASAANTSGRSVLLDSSLLGGMYANSIVLVGTDQGLGVNLPPEVLASTGGIAITNEGDIYLQKLTAKQAVAVKSAQSIAVNGQIYGQTHVSLQANNALDIKALIAARDSLMLNAAILNNHNEIMAGLNADGSQNKTGSVTITGAVINNQGRIKSSGKTDVNAGTLTNSSGSLIHAGGNLTLSSASDLTNYGEIIANGNLVASAIGRFTNHRLLSSAGVLNLTAQTLDNFSTISAGIGLSRIDITGTLNNQAGISASDILNISAQDIMNNGLLNAGKDLSITSNNLTNNQTLFAGNDMTLYTSNALLNNANANIFSLNNLTLSADAANGKTARIINYKGSIQAYSGNLNLFATDFQNITDAPIVQGSFDAATTQITKGTKKSTKTVTNPCVPQSINCEFVVTTRVDAMVLTKKSKPAILQAGGDLNLFSDTITNKYSLIAAGRNINLFAKVVDNLPVDIMEVTTITTDSYVNQKYCPRFQFLVCVGGKKNRKVFQGQQVKKIQNIVDSVPSIIQAGGNITGNAGNLNNGNIRGGQAIAATPKQTQQTGTNVNTAPTLALPTGSTGLFVVSKDPASQYLVETNPALTLYENFISSDYILQRLNYAPNHVIKRVGDAFYENKLIRDSILAQTGQRFLHPDLTDDRTQYQYLMDNALTAQQDLQLVPGIKLTSMQIQQLSQDIVWMEEQNIEGQTVLVPVVYIANAQNIRMNGGQILAGKNINLNVTDLNNAGLIQTGNNLAVNASGHITNKDGTMQSGNAMDMTADGNIENISGQLTGTNIHLTSLSGDIVNQQQTQQIQNSGPGYRSAQTMMGRSGSIEAQGQLTLNAANKISIQGSQLLADAADFNAKTIEILSTLEKADYTGGDSKNYTIERSETHHGSTLQANTIRMHSTGTTTIAGSTVNADDTLSITARDLAIVAVNDSHYAESKTSEKGFLSRSSTTEKHSTSTNIGSTISGENIRLASTSGDISIVGSDVAAREDLDLNSAANIDVRAGYDGTLDETQSKKSGWFTGGELFSKSEDLQGKLTKTAALANLSGGNVTLNANQDLTLLGVNIAAEDSLTGSAQNITVENANNEEKTYSKHNKMTVGLSDALKTIINPLDAVKMNDGQASITLATAEISQAETVTTRTKVVSSNLDAADINLIADAGDITVKGSHLTAKNDVNFTASGDVDIIEAHNTEKTASKDMKGTAELNVVVKHEAIAVVQAAQALKEAKDKLSSANSDYTEYKQELSKQKGQLSEWKLQLQKHQGGINQDDIAELQNIIHDLEGESKWYLINRATAAAGVAAATKGLYDEVKTAASSGSTWGLNGGLELEFDATKTNSQSQSSYATASNLKARNISIHSNNSATIQGSNLSAQDQINISANELNILSSQNTEQSSSDRKHNNITMSKMMHGSSAVNISASAERSKSSSSSLTHNNAQLNANQINLSSIGDTHIKGANLIAQEGLVATVGGDLTIESEYDTAQRRDRSTSMGLAYGSDNGVASGSGNYGNNKLDMHYRGVGQQTTIQTGDGGFNITTKGNTNLRGVVIKSSEQAIQNKKNQLTTATLSTSDMRNTSRADAKNSGFSLSSDMHQQGKYGAVKAATGALLNNGKGKRQTVGKTVTAMSTAQVNITDNKAQQALTGTTAQQAIDAINVDTIYTNLKANQANAEAAQKMAQTKQTLKMAVYRETVKFADEAYRTAYVKKAEMYKVKKDKNGQVVINEKTHKPEYTKLTEEEKLNLKPGKDGKVHIFNNGIFNGELNDPAAAAKYANQLANTTDGEIYLIHFPQAVAVNNDTDKLLSIVGGDGVLQELMIAGFQHFLEGGIADGSNATMQNVALMKKYGVDGLDISAHSRGTDTTGNAMQILLKDKNNSGVLSDTEIHYFGPADHAQNAANQLDELSGGNQPSITLQNHKDDFVGGLIGSNPATYGETPDGSNKMKESINIFKGDYTAHSCYGANPPPECKPFGTPQTLIIRSDRSKP